jgi:glycogen debranching enzyme GlgX
MDSLTPVAPSVAPTEADTETSTEVGTGAYRVLRTSTTGLQAGAPWPLGAHSSEGGVNFAVFSSHALAVDLCVFDDTGTRELARHRLPAHTQDIWHGFLPGARPGLVYGFRVHGPWRPDRGHHHNPNKLLLDPYAREIVAPPGGFAWRDELFAGDRQHPQHLDDLDSAPFALKARVLPPVTVDRSRWQGAQGHRVPMADTVLYELHVKGYTRLMPGVPDAQRGTYAGLASDAAIAHLKTLGVTSLSLLPVHAHLDEERLVGLGLSNYWGYNSIGFFAPEASYAASGERGARDEFRAMAERLHAEGFELLIDVVYNHTAEGDHRGPCLSFRGLDHASYYRSVPDTPALCENWTGCGNTLDIRHPRVLQLVLDSLRYWVEEMGVDGFRFDLAPILGRGDHGFDARSAFFTAIAQDPVLSRVKMIAEPWDIGPGGYQVGHFPRGWMEWNDKFRDGQRAFWLGSDPHGPRHASTRGDFAQRLCASSDLYEPRRRMPAESVNYITSHDGYCLADLLAYEQRHNHANGEDNRDGHGHNLSWNGGVEGPTTDPRIRQRRARLQRALLATNLLAQGTPMLCAGDEMGRTQRGNNNAYCQDNPTSWLDWNHLDRDLVAYTARVIALRKAALPLGNHWYSGLTDPLGLQDLSWLRADGTALEGPAWRDPARRVLGCLIGQPGRSKTPVLLLVNAESDDHAFQLPKGAWQCVLDSTAPTGESHWQGAGGVAYWLPAHSLAVFLTRPSALPTPPNPR